MTKYFSLLFLFDLTACSELPNVPHAHISEADRRAEFQEGNLIHFDCEAGYTSDQISTFVCTSEGWLATRRGMCFCKFNVFFCFTLMTVKSAKKLSSKCKIQIQEFVFILSRKYNTLMQRISCHFN